jgi:hypothetical protein
VTLDGDEAPLRVVARPGGETPDGGIDLDLAIISARDPSQVHFRAVAELGRTLPTLGVAGPAGTADGAGPLPMSVEDVYREWLFHGPIFRGIASVESIGPNGARAVLQPSSIGDLLGGAPTGDWLFDPVVVDGALQMQLIWARLHWGVTLLPSAGREFRRSGPLRGGTQGISYELRVRPGCRVPLCLADHLFHGPDGALVAAFKGLEGTGSKALNRLAGGTGR